MSGFKSADIVGKLKNITSTNLSGDNLLSSSSKFMNKSNFTETVSLNITNEAESAAKAGAVVAANAAKLSDRLSYNHKKDSQNSNVNKHVNLKGTASYTNENNIYISPEDGVNQMSGACENEDYIIVSFKDCDDTKHRIVIYDKKTNEAVGTFVTDKFGHSNGLTIDGDTVYVVDANDDDKLYSFSLSEALDKCGIEDLKNMSIMNFNAILTKFLGINSGMITPEIKEGDFQTASKNGGAINLTSISYDPKSGVFAAAYGDELYIVKDDKTTVVKKFNFSDQFAQTSQDICVAKDSIYVIRTKIAGKDDGKYSGTEYVDDNVEVPDSSLPERNQGVKQEYSDEYNLVDIYDLDGNYKCTKKIPIPTGRNDSFDCTYRELESVSYDESTDSFTMYFCNPFDKATDDHVIVRGVDLPSADES